MRRFFILVLLAMSMFVAGMQSQSALGQDHDLTHVFSEINLNPSLTIEESGNRNLEALSASFADPQEAERNLRSWGWQQNAQSVYADSANTLPGQAPTVISLHLFSDEIGASSALDYFVATRAAGLGLERIDVSQFGDQIVAISGESSLGTETTVYVRVGTLVARVTSGTTPNAVSLARSVVDAALGPIRYISPQFGYEIKAAPSFWPDVLSTSEPGGADILRLSTDDLYLEYEGRRVSSLPPPGTTQRDQALGELVMEFALARAEAHPGASVETRPNTLGARVTFQSDGVPRQEYIVLYPLLNNEGVVFSVFGYPDGWPWVGPRPPGIQDYEDWAVAAEDTNSDSAPWGLQSLSGLNFTVDDLMANMPIQLGRFTVTGPPVEQLGRWPITYGGMTFIYADTMIPETLVTVGVDFPGLKNEVPEIVLAGNDWPMVRSLINCCALAQVVDSDVRPSAAIQFFTALNEDGTAQLVWKLPKSAWVMTITAPTEGDLAEVVQDLVSQLESS